MKRLDLALLAVWGGALIAAFLFLAGPAGSAVGGKKYETNA